MIWYNSAWHGSTFCDLSHNLSSNIVIFRENVIFFFFIKCRKFTQKNNIKIMTLCHDLQKVSPWIANMSQLFITKYCDVWQDVTTSNIKHMYSTCIILYRITNSGVYLLNCESYIPHSDPINMHHTRTHSINISISTSIELI